jgi:hypothetical protein
MRNVQANFDGLKMNGEYPIIVHIEVFIGWKKTQEL